MARRPVFSPFRYAPLRKNGVNYGATAEYLILGLLSTAHLLTIPKIDGQWLIKDVPFVDNWSKEEYQEGIVYLKELIAAGGYAAGAFITDK